MGYGWLVVPILGIVGLAVFIQFFPLGLWIPALAAGVPGVNQPETHVLAGGSVDRVVTALISAERASLPLTFERACAIDLAGPTPLEAVQMSVIPRVIETPIVTGVAQDGVELKAFARVSLRANTERFVGGAGEQTVLARVGEGIVTNIGSSNSHKVVLQNPDEISRALVSKGLDAGTAFEILVGENIGARLRTAQAETDKQIAQTKAEEKRVMAIAHEQEMKAFVQEMRAKDVEAEANVPQALADALRTGKMGVLNDYNMRNLQADTEMRQGIG